MLPRWFLGPEHWIAVLAGLAAIAGAAVCLKDAISSRTLLDRTQSLLPLLWGGLGLFFAVVIAQIAGPFAPYYMASCAAGIALLIVQPLAWLHRTTIDAWTGRRAVGVAAAAVLLGSLAFGAIRHPVSHHENWRGAAGVVARAARPGDAIVFVGTSSYVFSSSSGLLGFTAAWREVPHPRSPTVISHDFQLAQPVIRTVAYAGSHSIQRAWLRRDRVWLVTYQNLLRPGELLDARIRNGYCVRESAHFVRKINVYLYVRKAPGQHCPSG